MRTISRAHPSLTLLAGIGGCLLGFCMTRFGPAGLAQMFEKFDVFVGQLFLAWLRGLAVPLIVSSVVVGTAGLEPMRAMGRILRKTIAWMVLSGLTASLVGLGASFLFTAATGEYSKLPEVIWPDARPWFTEDARFWGWPALALVALAVAYNRNQIEDGVARLLLRFCRALDDLLKPLLAGTAKLTPLGVFALAWIAGRRYEAQPFDPRERALIMQMLYALGAAWIIFGAVILPTVLWLVARINPLLLVARLLPAVTTAIGGSVEATLPLTLGTLRDRCHLSNRTAGPVLALCATFQREGLALGSVVVATCCARASNEAPGAIFFLCMIMLGTLMACGGTVFAGDDSMTYVLAGLGVWKPEWILIGAGVERLITLGGAGLSVLSHACAAAVIAKSEGEYWIPNPPPTSEELANLKAELEADDI